MVEDPNLIKHLLHFGINISNMEKVIEAFKDYSYFIYFCYII